MLDRPRDADGLTTPRGWSLALHRRTAIGASAAAVGAVLVSACTDGGPTAAPRGRARTVTPPADPDVALAAAVLADEQRVLDLVTATVARHPGLGHVLASARAAHQAHVRLLRDAAPDQPGPSPTVSPSPSATTGPVTGVAMRPAAALRTVATHEHGLALRDQRHALVARSGAFARVLGSMSASASQQRTLLTQAALTAGPRS